MARPGNKLQIGQQMGPRETGNGEASPMARAKDSSLSTSQPHRRARAPAPMQVESVPLGSVLPDPANVRRHDARNVDAIKASLARYGQVTPIVVDAHGIVRKGNGTLEAARQLGWAEVKVVRTALSGVDATGYAIADNRTSDLGTYDDDRLARILSELAAADSLVGVGYDGDDVDNLLASLSVMLPTADPGRPEPTVGAEVRIEIECSRAFLESISTVIADWQRADGVSVSVS